MKEVKLYPNRWKRVILLLVSLAFVYAGTLTASEEKIIAWLSIGFFGLGALVLLVGLLPGANYLKLCSNGFEICSLFRKHFTPWENVHEFGVSYAGVKKMVVFNYSEIFASHKSMRQVNKSITCGWDAGLPDMYGMEGENLAEKMNECLTRFRNAHA